MDMTPHGPAIDHGPAIGVPTCYEGMQDPRSTFFMLWSQQGYDTPYVMVTTGLYGHNRALWSPQGYATPYVMVTTGLRVPGGTPYPNPNPNCNPDHAPTHNSTSAVAQILTLIPTLSLTLA